MSFLLIVFGKCIIAFSKLLNLGNGSTWPGHIALEANKNFVRNLLKNSNVKTILVAGTNGKTTTVKLIETILKSNGKKVFRNEAGANLLNGIASTLIQQSNLNGSITHDFALFEVDENSLPHVLHEFSPDYIVILNLFRDQLDRYGETDIIAKKWQKALKDLPLDSTLILNADDPQIAEFGNSLPRHSGLSRIRSTDTKRIDSGVTPFPRMTNVLYFGLNESKTKTHEHAVDSVYCPQCNEKLSYKSITYSHLGNWHCSNCQNKRPKLNISEFEYYPLSGTYNEYNTLSAVLTARSVGISDSSIQTALESFTPAFGRQEELEFEGKKIKIFLSKNPTGFNESLRTIKELKTRNILLVLNDRIPDGRDVSWIWDIDFEELLSKDINVVISGDRVYDMGLRIKYANSSTYKLSATSYQLEEDLEKAITKALKTTKESEVLYILPTYSAMLEVRKIVTGRKLL